MTEDGGNVGHRWELESRGVGQPGEFDADLDVLRGTTDPCL
jgi:hypothetical protein